MHLPQSQNRRRIAIVLAMSITAMLHPKLIAQQIFREATGTPSHRVLEGADLPNLGLPSMIQGALLKKLEQHIAEGNRIDHERLTDFLDGMRLNSETQTAIENMAWIISPEDSSREPSLPENLQNVVDRQIEQFEFNQSDAQRAGATQFDPATLQNLLKSNQSFAESFRADERSANRLSELARRFQERSNKTKRPTSRSRANRRQTRPHRARSNTGRRPGDGALTKKLLESAFEAMDESSMDFLKAAKNGNRKRLDFSWLTKATRSINSGVQDVNRSIANVSSVDGAVSRLPIPEDGGRDISTTVLVLSALGLVGILLRRRFQNLTTNDSAARKASRFSSSSIVDRESLVDGVNLLASEICGDKAALHHHGKVFAQFGQVDESAVELAPIYANCRYAPEEFRLRNTELENVRRVLANLQRRLGATNSNEGPER